MGKLWRLQRGRAWRARPATAPGTSCDVAFFSLGDDEFAIIDVAAERSDPSAAAARLSACSVLAPLSAAESRILAELLTGCSNRQIAARRGTSLRTVTNQVSAVFDKLGVRSRAELVLLLADGPPAPGTADDTGT